MVEVPEELRGPVWRALMSDLRRRSVLDGLDGGVSLTPSLREFLWALRHDVADRPEDDSSARGSAAADPAMVVTTAEVAELLGCSPRWARELVKRAGGHKQGRDWVVERSALDDLRFNTNDA